MYTMRSGTAAFYDKRIESGSVNISGPRSGCTNSVIPANGVLNVPFYYVGCTCSYPLPTGLALTSMPESYEQWSSWGTTNPEPVRDIVRIGVNFGAPGDRMASDGTLWLNYPDVGGPSPVVEMMAAPDEATYFYRHSLPGPGSQLPWVTNSGAEGLTTFTISGLKAGSYHVRLYFPATAAPRSFDVAIQGRTVLGKEAGEGVSRSFQDIFTEGTLTVTLTPHEGKTAISGIEIVAAALKTQ
jgi:hypothetical protein